MTEPEKIMPHLSEQDGRVLWIDNVREDRSTDLMQWTTPNDPGTLLVPFDEEQARSLSDQLVDKLGEWDGEQIEEDRLHYRRRELANARSTDTTATYSVKVMGPDGNSKWLRISTSEFNRLCKVIAPN